MSTTNSNQPLIQYKIDIVFCIDSTGSMSPIIDQVKNYAKNLHNDLFKRFLAGNKPIAQLRIKLISFADYATEGDEAVLSTKFFTLPDDLAEFEEGINLINIENKGGDVPENAYEALWEAIQSDWVPIASDGKGRHIIVMLTDAYPLDFQERAGCLGYAEQNYPQSLAEMQEIWDELDNNQGGKSSKISNKYSRLVLFAPEGDDGGHSWNDVKGWKRTIPIEVDAATGLKDTGLNAVIEEIFLSVG